MPSVPDDERVGQLYRKLYGKHMTPRSWQPDQRNQAQQITYLEEACRDIVDTIQEMRDLEEFDPDASERLVTQLRREIHFLNTIIRERAFLSSLSV